jgi:hypothetical protein
MAGGLGHVVIEHPDPWVMGEHVSALRDARFSVLLCDGPRFRRTGCPAVTDGRCGLIDRADVVVSCPPPDDAAHTDVIASVRRAYPGTPVIAAESCADPMALVEAVTAAAAYVHRPHGRRWCS